MKKIEIAPSILSADFRKLEREVKMAEDAGADRIHCDVMDGHFVPNITFGPLVIEAVKKSVSIPLDVHLMISNPEKYIGNFCDAGADILMIHAEACKENTLPDLLKEIRNRGVKSGVTINPDKSIDLFIEHLSLVDQVLIMTVYAGFGGQKFIKEMMSKTKAVYDRACELGLDLDIEVDGGINHETVIPCVQNGVNVFVAGSYVFGSENYAQKISAIRDGAMSALGV